MNKIKVVFDGGMQAHEAGVFDAVSFAADDKGVMLCMADSKKLASFDDVTQSWYIEGQPPLKYVRLDVVRE